MEYILLVVGLVALVVGGEALVRGAVSIALKAKISPLVIGMTVVSFGTSAPELLVSLEAVLNGYPDVSVGAVIGSNISNLGLVLGITALIFPIVISRDSLRIDWPLMMFASILVFFFSMDNQISFYEGAVFVLILGLFFFWLIYRSRRQGIQLAAVSEVEELNSHHPVWKDVLFFLIGIAGLYFGAEWLIDGVVVIAKSNGISEKLISVTVVAFGTSLPELVTSVMAAIRKETDISIGNLIGSNIFNIFAILGVTAIVQPLDVSESMNVFDLPFMLALSLLLLPLMYFGREIGRFKGVLLVAIYLIYVYCSILNENIGVLG